MSRQDGFSMIELIVAMVMGGIILSATGVAIQTADRNSKAGAALHRMLSDVRFAQETAMGQNRDVLFTVSTTSSGYTATYTDGSLIPTPMKSTGLAVTLNTADYKGILITATGLSNALTFAQNGDASIGGAPLTSNVVIATLTGSRSLMINPAGYTYIQ